ncbi:MAG: sigma-70 family RNA polymerase sigma factor [Pirellulales bacterium]
MNQNFSTTRWSMVLRARGADAPAGRALAELCERYWLPLYGFARRKCGSVDEAQDLTQGFFVELLERDLLQRADPQRGRFRTFLLTSFEHFAAHQRERQRAAKRGGGRVPFSLDFAWADARLAVEPAVNESPEREFERLWALELLQAALEAVQSQYEARGQGRVFDTLKPFMLGEQGQARLAQAAEELGISEGAAKVALHRLRTRYGEALRAEISGTLSDPSEIDDEIRRLFAAFA